MTLLFRKAFFVLLTMLTLVQCGFSLQEKVLILPPASEDQQISNGVSVERWRSLATIYSKAVLDTEPVPFSRLIEYWQGDTLAFDVQMIEEATEIGQDLGADRIILVEWNDEEWGGCQSRAVDLWNNTISDVFTGSTPEATIRSLEGNRWIYGVLPVDSSPEFYPPEFVDGKDAVHRYLHEKRVYPSEAVIEMVSCRALVEVVISPEGIPLKVQVYNVSEPGWGFEDAMEKALWAVPYSSGTWNGKPVTSRLKRWIKVSFKR